MQRELTSFAKEYAMVGMHRASIRTNKTYQYRSAIDMCKNFTWNTAEMQEATKIAHEQITIAFEMLVAAKQAKKAKRQSQKSQQKQGKPRPRL